MPKGLTGRKWPFTELDSGARPAVTVGTRTFGSFASEIGRTTRVAMFVKPGKEKRKSLLWGGLKL